MVPPIADAFGVDVPMPARMHRAGEVGRIAVVHASSLPPTVPSPESLVSRLRSHSHDVWPVTVRRDLVDALCRDEPDMVIVQWQPGGFDLGRLCRDLRESLTVRIVVVADVDVTTSIDEEFIVDVLDGGADDFITAATGEAVMMARIRVALRAKPVLNRRPRRVVVGDIEIDIAAHTVTIGARAVRCPPLQFQLLAILAREPGVMVHRDRLFAELWGVAPSAVDPRRLRIAVSLLRGILGTGPQRPVVETVARVGYRLVEPQGTSPLVPPT